MCVTIGAAPLPRRQSGAVTRLVTDPVCARLGGVHPARHSRWVHRLSFAGVLAGFAIAGGCLVAGATDLAFLLFLPLPLALGLPPWLIGTFLIRPRCPQCGRRTRAMPGRRVEWFCAPCRRIYGDEDGTPKP